MSIRLRDLIRNVRTCKTAADERAVIAKECAAIRTAFKDEDNQYRFRNVAKLLFIHMLGYPTHFGQIECLKLIASPKYPEKRIGYLGLVLLLDDEQEVLSLVENSLRKDFVNASQYIVGLALGSLGNVCNDEMARNLLPEVEKLYQTTNPYIKKKAALVMIRIFKRLPDLISEYYERVSLGDRVQTQHHGILLTTVSLVTDMCELDHSIIPYYRKSVLGIVKILQGLTVSSYSPEYDVGGIVDPFLQCKILHLLRVLGKGDKEASEKMNDILAQVATNTDTTKNPGHAIVYECVQTILAVESEPDLRVLAINILGRFLLNRDNNIRYVALNTLVTVVRMDMSAVQRHRPMVLECLKDPDISIRRRALDLSYQLVTPQNIEIMGKELLDFLSVSEPEFKEDFTSKLISIFQLYAPNKQWHIDAVLKVLFLGGEYVREEVGAAITNLIAATPELQAHATHQLYSAALNSLRCQTMVQVTVWAIGEFGDELVQGKGRGSSETEAPTPSQIVDFIEKILKSGLANQTTKYYCTTCLLKLSSRFSQDIVLDRLKQILEPYQQSVNVELQQRSCEAGVLLNAAYSSIRPSLLELMPVVEAPAKNTEKEQTNKKGAEQPKSKSQVKPQSQQPKQTSQQQQQQQTQQQQQQQQPVQAANNSDDLLGLLFNNPVPNSTGGVNTNTQKTNAPSGVNALIDLLNDIPTTNTQTNNTTNNLFMMGNQQQQQQPMMGNPMMGNPMMGNPMMGNPIMGNQQQQPIMGAQLMMGNQSLMGNQQPTMMVNQQQPIMGNPLMGSASPSNARVVVFEKNGIKIVFNLSKPPVANVTQIDAEFSSSLPSVVENFSFQAAVPKTCVLQLGHATSSSIPPNNQGVVTQVLRITNPMAGQTPTRVLMKVTGSVNGQPFEEKQPTVLPSPF